MKNLFWLKFEAMCIFTGRINYGVHKSAEYYAQNKNITLLHGEAIQSGINGHKTFNGENDQLRKDKNIQQSDTTY